MAALIVFGTISTCIIVIAFRNADGRLTPIQAAAIYSGLAGILIGAFLAHNG